MLTYREQQKRIDRMITDLREIVTEMRNPYLIEQLDTTRLTLQRMSDKYWEVS